MFRKLLRGLFTGLGAITGYGVFLLCSYIMEFFELGAKFELSNIQEHLVIAALVIIFGLIFFRLTPMLGKQGNKFADNIATDLQKVSTNNLIMGTIGLLVGLLIAFLLSRVYAGMLPVPFEIILNVVSYLLLGYMGIIVATKSGTDIHTFFSNAKKGGGGKNKGKVEATPKIFDTSVIIDGRIADIMKTGFIEGPIVIPEFVLVELRHIADSSDSLKRNRGRRGLDVLNKIQDEYGIEIYNTTSEKSLDEIPEVDVKLLKLAQIMNGKVVTNDFNLNKVASIKGVEVLNINELANTLKPVVLPGEDMQLFLVKEGKERNQAVAYLDDGTMIVVEDGRKYIGSNINVQVTSVLQTAAGRMIFAKPNLR